MQRHSAVWNRAQLVFELGRALPTLPPDTDPEAYLDELAEEALSGRAEDVTVLQVAPVPDVIDVTRLGFRKDGTTSTGRRARRCSAPPSTATMSSDLVDVAALPVPQRRHRGRPRPRRIGARTWTIRSGRRSRAC